MAGGGAGVNGENGQVGAGPESGYEGSPQGAQSPYVSSQDVYSQLVQPSTNTIAQAYAQSLGRTPDTAGANFWANAAQQHGWDEQQLSNAINESAGAERETTGYQSLYNPQSFGSQRIGTAPSYYNTNPYAVDYANIFNPRAGQVAFAQPVMTPQQQAQYLGNWQQDYSQRTRAATEAANKERTATANKQWSDYLTNKAQAEATSQDAINKAVEEKLTSMGYGTSNNDNSYGYYYGAAGGSVPGGLRSLRGK